MTEEFHAPEVKFRFVEFNERREMRGKEAARVEVIEDGEVTIWLWMSKRDIDLNIREFGADPELVKARLAYTGRR